MRRWMVWMLVAAVALGGCGEGDKESELPNSSPGDLEMRDVDWVVDGMECGGEEVPRLVSLVDAESGRAEYRRDDECVEAGDEFWASMPTSDGDEVEVQVDASESTRVSYLAERAGDYSIRLAGAEDHPDLTMRQVHPEETATPIPDLSDFDLGGQWWMEGYPCAEEIVPQTVHVLHRSGGFLEMSKIVGDACIGDGQRFIEQGAVEGTSVSGVALLEEPPEGPGGEDDVESVEVTGTVYTEHYIRLDVAGRAVSLRRVRAEP